MPDARRFGQGALAGMIVVGAYSLDKAVQPAVGLGIDHTRKSVRVDAVKVFPESRCSWMLFWSVESIS